MDIETFRNYCLSKKGAAEDLPFGPDALVFKVMGKIFALASLDEIPLRVNLKCDPEQAITLREEHSNSIFSGYHMNKKHWNTLVLDGFLPNSLIFGLTDHSYNRVIQGLPKRLQKDLESLE
ncbi:MmcQ/YjbR family DNA-binding protein [Gillisia limnaea]|uniref:MmcQ-like protein n=1 Tax=Gillisia limnaea (strain DSM 15749 / LMG 21470 / R-8282) TaxID=865937 RepID=H2BRV8_GILLR|nr:MmcQ/YjbR family DNA-binding protein [Gillisia limnaea]EHQ02445.1 hypothetical protein Gilli_1803 [Gillisia limnaea DSM 15749]